MSYNEFMNKVRYWDNLTAKWLMRHFYFTFFQFVLVGIFIIWFINLFRVIDTSVQIPKAGLLEQILTTQSVNLSVIVLLMILNSFWLLFIFNGLQRLRNLLKDISYHLSRIRTQNK